MNKKEFAIIASALRTYYPKENILPNDKALDLWYEQLKDIPYEVCEAALNKWVAINKWSPSIADLREQAAELTQDEVKPWGYAWGLVVQSFGTYGYYKEAEAMESFDDLTRVCVQRIGYRNLCLSDNITADRANFRQIYEQEAERRKKDAQIPPRLKALISNMHLGIEKGAGA